MKMARYEYVLIGLMLAIVGTILVLSFLAQAVK